MAIKACRNSIFNRALPQAMRRAAAVVRYRKAGPGRKGRGEICRCRLTFGRAGDTLVKRAGAMLTAFAQ